MNKRQKAKRAIEAKKNAREYRVFIKTASPTNPKEDFLDFHSTKALSRNDAKRRVLNQYHHLKPKQVFAVQAYQDYWDNNRNPRPLRGRHTQ